MPTKRISKRKVEFHFIGEHHAADLSLPEKERTLSRLKRAIEESKGKKTVVALEMSPQLVEKLKKFVRTSGGRKITEEDIKKEFGEDYGWLVDYANIIKDHKDLDFVGVDIDTENKEHLKAAIDIARRNYGFLNKAMSKEVWEKLSEAERDTVLKIAEALGRNEIISLEVERQLGLEGKDKVIYVGGSVHSTVVNQVKEDLKRHRIDVKSKIEHNFENELKRYTGNLRMLLSPKDTLIREIHIKNLENLSNDEIREIIKKTTELQNWHTRTMREHYRTLGKYSFAAYQAASRGIGIREKRIAPAEELLDLITKIKRKHKK